MDVYNLYDCFTSCLRACEHGLGPLRAMTEADLRHPRNDWSQATGRWTQLGRHRGGSFRSKLCSPKRGARTTKDDILAKTNTARR